MKFSLALAVALFLPALVNAQNNTTPPPSPGPTPSAAPSNNGITTPVGSISSAAPSNSGPTMTAPGGSTFSASPSADAAGTSGSTVAPQSSSPNLTPDVVPATTPPSGSSQAAGQGQDSTAGVKPTATSAAPTLQETCPPGNTCVQVGSNGQLNYNPSNFAASNGTVVTFFFPQGSTSNSVTQGSFDQPCVYLAASGGNSGGFDSGLQNDKMFSIKVTDDQLPIYFFSKEQKFCGQGMVGAINPPSTGNTFNAYSDAAKALGPNQELLPDNGPVLGGVGAQAVGTPSPIPTTKGTSSSSHLVANGFVALLAAVFGVTLA